MSKYPLMLKTLTLSIFIHILLGICLSKIDFGASLNSNYQIKRTITVILIEYKTIQYEKNANMKEYKRQDNSSISDNVISNSSATYGKTPDITGNMTSQKEKLLLAALNEMTDLVSKFNFRAQHATKDSTGAFSPIQGFAPDTEALSMDLSNGVLKVKGFGRSECSKKAD